MSTKLTTGRRTLEIMLVVVVLGMSFLLYRLGGHKMVILNLFFLPIVVSGYFLGRTSAGVLALLCALCAGVITTVDSSGLAAYTSPELVALALAIWAAVLGLTAILIGTLCDERAATIDELHLAYVGVVEVLSKYLHCADPHVRARSARLADLSVATGEEMKLPWKELDNLRVGALLQDLGNVEITTQLITRAMDTLQTDAPASRRHTFQGVDLVESLGSVLHGAVPLLMSPDDAAPIGLEADGSAPRLEIPAGYKILRTVRAYDALTVDAFGEPAASPSQALAELRKVPSVDCGTDILAALERAVTRNGPEQAIKRGLAATI